MVTIEIRDFIRKADAGRQLYHLILRGVSSKASTSLAYLNAFFPDVPARSVQQDFEMALRAVGFGVREQQSIGLSGQPAYHLRRLLGRAARNIFKGSGSRLLCLMMGPASYRLVPDGILHCCALHCWDTWPDNYAAWDSLLTRFKTEIAFFSSRQARDRFQWRFPAMQCFWNPEGCAPEMYCPEKPLITRNIDVLELGRRYERYHHAVASTLVEPEFVHLYERQPGHVIFPGREALLEGLADSKMIVCFPASITNPERGSIETVTSRYFEAMASGCLVIGHCPAELRDLFGYNPVIEADMDKAAEQIKLIVSTIEQFQSLVGRNLAAVKRCGTWLHRAEAAKKILEAENGIVYS